MKARVALVVVLDVALWVLALWCLLGPPGPVSPRAWHAAARSCWYAARYFGQLGLVAESHYWRAVRQ